MDSAKLILTDPVQEPNLLHDMKRISEVPDEQKKQFAKDFESVFINKMLDEMKKTIVDWSGEKDEATKQTEGIFWMYLARDIANNGGFGLWKDIYNSMGTSEQNNSTANLLSEKI